MRWRSILKQVALPVAILSFYFVVPFGDGSSPLDGPLGLAISALCIAVVFWVIVDEARQANRTLRPIQLLIAFELVWVTFSLVYFLIARDNPDQFTGLETKVDGLYFSLTTMSTVGYGDIHAQGQLARTLVTTQLAFNLAFVAAVVALFQDMVKRKDSRRRLRRDRETEAEAPADGETESPGSD